ncbi:MAG: hypothetical protein NTY62_03680 [Euryarchaeota archaeon]|nr:hypothetical protein [Euryarchaeota archaeon]
MGSDATVNPEIIKKRMWLAYQYACSNPANERTDCVHALITKLADPEIDMHMFLQEAADTINAKLAIKETTIGLRSPSDGMYRYEVMSGLTDSEWDAHKHLSYNDEDFHSQDVYKSMQISRYTRLLLAEDNPYANGEETTYERDLMLQSKRKSLDDTIEGDYLDVCIFGKGDDLLGWIEISGMKNGRFPDTEAIKCLELLASVIGVALARHQGR